MSGLELSDYDPSWPQRYESEAARLADAIGPLAVEIQHVGSTSVPGLAAKPTVDVAVGVSRLAVDDEFVARMSNLGYSYAGDNGLPAQRVFRKGAGVPWEVLVHVVEWGGPMWLDFIAFRDYLRSRPEAARRYEGVKRGLLAVRDDWYHGVDKQPFIRDLLERSRASRISISSSSPEETESFAARLALELRVGDVVTVSGELGAGKTTFVRGACRALGVTAPVTSPTYTIGHRYRGRPDVSHLDLYRFSDVSPAEWADLEPYFEDAVAFVEWPEAAGTGLPAVRARVHLEHVDPTHRSIRLDAAGAALVERFARADPGVRHGD